MDELIERLRSEAEISDRPGQFDRLNALADEFAAEIEALRAEAAEWKRVAAAQAELLGNIHQIADAALSKENRND